MNLLQWIEHTNNAKEEQARKEKALRDKFKANILRNLEERYGLPAFLEGAEYAVGDDLLFYVSIPSNPAFSPHMLTFSYEIARSPSLTNDDQFYLCRDRPYPEMAKAYLTKGAFQADLKEKIYQELYKESCPEQYLQP